jgi:hypothetical protein
MKKTKRDFEIYLNGIDIPEHDKKSNGGRIKDSAYYGTWLRKNDPIAFEVGFREWN